MTDICLKDGSVLVVVESLTEIQLLAQKNDQIKVNTLKGSIFVECKQILDLRDHVETVG